MSLDTTVFDAVIAEGDVAACRQLAVELATFLADPTAPADEKEAVVPAVLKLAATGDIELRRQLADRLARCATLHADIVFTVAADDDDIALPFLAASPALDAWRMLAIVQVGDEARQAVIARRRDIHPEVVTAIVKKAARSIVATLLDNPACRLRPSDYRRIHVRFSADAELLEQLLARPDVPAEVRILQTRLAVARLHSLLAERGWMTAEEAEALLAEAEEATVLRILDAAEDRQLDRLIAFLSGKDMLHASLILRAACRGRMAVVERALAWLSSVPAKRVRALLAGHRSVGLRAVFGAAGLPAESYPLFKAAVEVWRNTREGPDAVAPERFGRQVVEALMILFPAMPAQERARLLALVSRFTDENARALAHRLRDKVLQAA